MRQNFIIEKLKTETEILSTFPLMRQLRAHLTAEEYLKQVQHQQATMDWHLAALKFQNKIVCIAGYRISTSLAWGNFLYLDDLVTEEFERSKGYGKAMLEWLKTEAQTQRCSALHLDSGLPRVKVHSFYEREGLEKAGYHFMSSI